LTNPVLLNHDGAFWEGVYVYPSPVDLPYIGEDIPPA